MSRFTQSSFVKNITWLVLVSFIHFVLPQKVWAGSPWVNKQVSGSKFQVAEKEEVTGEKLQGTEEGSKQEAGNKKQEKLDLSTLDSKPQPSASNLQPLAARFQPSDSSSSSAGTSDAAPLPPVLSPKKNDALSAKGQTLRQEGSGQASLRTGASLPVAAVLDVYSTTLSATEVREISSSFRRELKNTGRFLVYSKAELRKALNKNLDQEVTVARQIDEYVTQARRLYDEFKFDSAAAIMKEAMAKIVTFDATPAVARKISEAYLIQGLILQAQNKDKEADVSFLNAAALDPDRQLNPTQYPPGVIGKFYQAKAEFPKIKQGSLRIETTPPVAEVILGDKQLGTSPSTLKNLALGVQKVTLFKDGFEPWEKNVMVVATAPNDYVNKLEVNLDRVGQSISLDALIGEVVSHKDYESQISKMADVGKLLLADQVFAARIEKGDQIYEIFLTEVDAQSGREIAKGYAAVDPKLADVDVGFVHALADMLNGKQAAKSTDLIAVEGKETHYMASYKKSKPFYKKWPFYLLIGLAVAGGGAGAALALSGGGNSTGSATLGGAPQP
jgi:hypothetical protein